MTGLTGGATRLRRRERRDQLLAAATRAFARSGFAATSLDDAAAEAHISRVILYRHFESKTDLYRAVLERAAARLAATVGTGDYGPDAIDRLLEVAAEDPEAFRLLFHHAAREPEFRSEVDEMRAQAVGVARRQIRTLVPDHAWSEWASQLVTTMAIESVIAWLDVGQPDPERTAQRIMLVVGAIVRAART